MVTRIMMRMSSSLVAIAPRSPDTLTPHVPAAPRVVLSNALA